MSQKKKGKKHTPNEDKDSDRNTDVRHDDSEGEDKKEAATHSKNSRKFSIKDAPKKHKEKKNIRFQVPSSHVASEDSFSSALSYNLKENKSEFEEFVPTQFTVFNKFTSPSLNRSQPRKAPINTFLNKYSDHEILNLPASSSLQLFQVMRDSPTPSDANINLLKAIYLRKADAVMNEIKNGANVNVITEGQTPLVLAAEIGDDRLVECLLKVPNVNLDFRNSFGQTALIIAVRNEFITVVKLLLSHNADANIADNMGRTAIHGAIFQGNLKLVKLLLAYGANVEKEDCFGEKPLYTCAVKIPNKDCLVMLLKMGAEVNYITFTGVPLLSRAILEVTDFSIIECLVQYGASVNAQDTISKKTPLHFAALQNNVRILKFLVENGADLNAKTSYQFTPFDEAISQRNMQAIEYLYGVMFEPKERMKKETRRKK